jgi:hypothetical protein
MILYFPSIWGLKNSAPSYLYGEDVLPWQLIEEPPKDWIHWLL